MGVARELHDPHPGLVVARRHHPDSGLEFPDGSSQDKVEADIHPVAAFAIGSAHGAIFFDAHHRESTCSAN
ncbi:hypothetical protein GLA29479_464 [Lysobacter antibioticus]|uniref:Uncharacterized protein n=1 Tax=Lysobacter antibioticus TaxID=84531 RepID=A0A0S2DSG5_LYSAN|nr:hypothetical protein GLA29479_464 [Lysobacter antibioticus]ALN82998.1 hypothetical protein LA76x_4895 [Lysobacter antibioticus]